jgi:UDP-N-acetylmuramoyl-L-alanyl-D-glutamate--2,6-diaminopimelate ligase
MKKLSDLLADVRALQIVGNADVEVVALEYDSRRVEAGHCFFAVVGTASDGHSYIA